MQKQLISRGSAAVVLERCFADAPDESPLKKARLAMLLPNIPRPWAEVIGSCSHPFIHATLHNKYPKISY
jgi:hypothetical protein